MKRLFFLAPNLKSTTSIVAELKEADVPDAHIHIVGKDYRELEDAHLHEATVFQTTNLIPSLEKGAVAGGAIGLLAGLTALVFPPGGLILGGGAVLGLSLFGSGFGAWASSMIGIAKTHPKIEQFQDAIDEGQFLMIVDVPKDMQQFIKEDIKKHHPEALIEDIDLPKKGNQS